jgi:hypothetical protein
MAYSLMNLAYDVLMSAKLPLTYQEIWQTGQQNGLGSKILTTGKTPWQSLGSDMRCN